MRLGTQGTEASSSEMPSGANAQLAENARLLLSEQSPCAKHFYLGDFDVTLHKSDASAKLDEGCIAASWAITDSGARLPE